MCSIESWRAVVGGENGFDLPEDRGENIVADISSNYCYGPPGRSGGFTGIKNVRTASLSALDKSLSGQKRERLPHGLPADAELMAQELFGGQKHPLLIDTIQNIIPKSICHLLIFRSHALNHLRPISFHPQHTTEKVCFSRYNFKIQKLIRTYFR